MSDGARDRAARLRRRGAEQAAQTAEEARAGRPEGPNPAKEVRTTFDLPEPRHLALTTWRMEAAIELGRRRVSTQDALHAMVCVLLSDETVARRVRMQLERGIPDPEGP